MSVRIGKLNRKRVIRKMDGTIYEMIDQTLPDPVVIKGGVVMQPEVIQKMQEEQQQKIKDAQANAVAQSTHAQKAQEQAELEKENLKQDILSAVDKKLDEKFDLIMQAIKEK